MMSREFGSPQLLCEKKKKRLLSANSFTMDHWIERTSVQKVKEREIKRGYACHRMPRHLSMHLSLLSTSLAILASFIALLTFFLFFSLFL